MSPTPYILLSLFLLLQPLKSQLSTTCHPQCSWKCDDPRCDAICEPVCEPPKCHTSCQEPKNAVCDVKCEKPDCQIMCPDKACEAEDCPKCVTICKPPHCVTHCQSPKPVCEAICQEPNCDWKCHKPECPKPKCELVCENPGCRPTVECCKCEDHLTHLDLALPVFKEVEKDPRCCSCDKNIGLANAPTMPRFTEVENKPEELKNSKTSNVIDNSPRFKETNEESQTPGNFVGNRSINFDVSTTPLDHINLSDLDNVRLSTKSEYRIEPLDHPVRIGPSYYEKPKDLIKRIEAPSK